MLEAQSVKLPRHDRFGRAVYKNLKNFKNVKISNVELLSVLTFLRTRGFQNCPVCVIILL